MITDDDVYVPAVERRQIVNPLQGLKVNSVGLTVTECAICRAECDLSRESYLIVGQTLKVSRNGYFDKTKDYRWVEVEKERRAPTVKKLYVCGEHYSNRFGKPVIPIIEHRDTPLAVEKRQWHEAAKLDSLILGGEVDIWPAEPKRKRK